MHDPMQPPIHVILVGASGAVGSRIDALATSDPRFDVVARIDRQRPHHHADMLRVKTPEIIVDFSHFSAVEASASLARQRRAPILVGTTALAPNHLDTLAQLARDVPVLIAPNTSVGSVVLLQIVQKIASALGENFFPSITEWHRQGKADAPSGTANALRRAIEDAARGARDFGPMAVASVRAGSIVGEHLVRFDGPEETLELVHKAHSRDLFARGALRAAQWLVAQKPGLYGMIDVLGLRDPSNQGQHPA